MKTAKSLVIAVFVLLLGGCRPKISNEERLHYYAVISLQIKEAETLVNNFNRHLIEIKRADKPASAETINDLRTSLFSLTREVEKSTQIVNELHRQRLDMGLKKYGAIYLNNMSGFLKNVTPRLINQLDTAPRQVLNIQGIEQFKELRKEMDFQGRVFHYILSSYVRQYKLSTQQLEQYGLQNQTK